jgi:uncharacterized membrane protein
MVSQETFTSDISNTEFPEAERVPGRTIRKPIFALIKEDYPGFSREQSISLSEHNAYKVKYIGEYFSSEMGELSRLEDMVMHSITSDKLLSKKVQDEVEQMSVGERIADKVAEFGGSWTFIISFGVFILIWIAVNVYVLLNKGFDPYPFILLNLLLSCLAALQAPVIMMSQNRQEDKDRERARKDYMINLKSELEIRMVHEKLDYLIMNQQQELIEWQKTQMEIMNEILEQVSK